jgi:hypothetical protein
MLRYIGCAPLSLAMNILVMVFSPVLALIPAAFRLENLPGPLWYLQTHDDWVYGHGWPKPDVPPSFGERWKIAMWWLARNPAYAFDAYVLGFSAEGVTVTQTSTLKSAGIHDDMTDAKGRRYFGYRRDLPLFGDRYCKIWLGWSYKPQAGRHMLKLDLNPFKRKS